MEELLSIPVRSLHNYLYCHRLMYFQFVEKVYVENKDTVIGNRVHNRVDEPTKLDSYADIASSDKIIHRSLALESNRIGFHGVVDLVEKEGDVVRIIDYKKGSPLYDSEKMPIPKEADAMQVQAYALLMKENGIPVHEGLVYYAQTKTKVPVKVDDQSISYILGLVDTVRKVSLGQMPEPLHGDTRCLYCSLYPVCLPEETLYWKNQSPLSSATKHPLVDAKSGEVIIVQEPDAYISKKGESFIVTKSGKTLSKHPVENINNILLYGAPQFSTQVLQTCLEYQIPISLFSPAGRYLGQVIPLTIAGLDSRHGQYRFAENESQSIAVSRCMIAGKISNQRVLLQRNAPELKDSDLGQLAKLKDLALEAVSRDELNGIEGRAAAIYFANFPLMIKNGEFKNIFNERNRRPPKDPINAMLSLGYSVLVSEIAGICSSIGLDPSCGLLHIPRYGRPALALDLMEEFRPIIVDSIVISLINRQEVTMDDFIFSSKGCNLNNSGRKSFWGSYFHRINTEITHPEFNYKMSYRRMFEIQARQLWRIFRGDTSKYYPVITR